MGKLDFIIVGSGTAGSLLSHRLAKAGQRCMLLEAGPSNHVSKITPWLRVPLGYLYTMTMKSTAWEGFKTRVGKDRVINYPRGRVLGGCSSINGMIYQQGNPLDYDNWKVDGWSGDDMSKKFDSLREKRNWPCEKQRLSWDVLQAFERAVEEVVPTANKKPNVGGGGRTPPS